LKEKAIKDFHSNLQIILKNINIDPEQVEREILEFKNSSQDDNNQIQISEHDNNQVDNLSNRTIEHLQPISNNNHLNLQNNQDSKILKSNEYNTNNNQEQDNNEKDQNNNSNIDSKYNKDKSGDIKLKNIKQIEFKLRSDKRMSERIKSIDKNYERRIDLYQQKKNEIKGINPNNP